MKTNKRINSKAKGAQYERAVCKLLSLWISQGQSDNEFWRSAMSGGRSTIDKSGRRKAQCGDISAITARAEKLTNLIYFECKNVRSLEFNKLIHKGRGFIFNTYITTLKEALKYNKIPCIIGKENMQPMLVVAKKGLWNILFKGKNKVKLPSSYQVLNINDNEVELFLFDDLLKTKYTYKV